MSIVKGKLEHTEENMQLILDLTQNEKYCCGINDYGFICYMKFDEQNAQLWAIVSAEFHNIRNAGLNLKGEHRVWNPNIGFSVNLDVIDLSKQNLNSVTFFQAFSAMRLYVIWFWEKTYDNDIGMLITDFMITNVYDDWKSELYTWDPPVKDDWMNGVYKTLKDFNVKKSAQQYMYNEVEAFLCMKNYLQIFNKEYPFEGLKKLLVQINLIKVNSNSVESDEWLKCIQLAVEQEDAIIA